MFKLKRTCNFAEIITLRAIALKLEDAANLDECLLAEIITLRAIALKPFVDASTNIGVNGRDHNATSYSTETKGAVRTKSINLRRDHNATSYSTETRFQSHTAQSRRRRRDHNATSYSTETVGRALRTASRCRRDHNATSYSTETVPKGRFTETGCRQQRS